MKSKKGTVEISSEFLIDVIKGVLLLGAVIIMVVALLSIFEKSNVECLNSRLWDDKDGLKDFLKKADKKDFSEGEFFFDNEDCKIVSFSFLQGIEGNKIKYPNPLPKEPVLCLCQLESSLLEQTQCMPHDCYKFTNYQEINNKQFSTENYKKYMVLRFVRDGNTLRIEPIGAEKDPEPVYYKREQETLADPGGLIHSLNILFRTSDIASFMPLVKIKEEVFLLPQEIPKVEGFTFLFDMELALPRLEGQTEEDYLVNRRKISPDLVRQALVVLELDKTKFVGISQEQKGNIAIYYKTKDGWNSERLKCIENENILCQSVLNEFSENFAVSINSTKNG